LPTLFRVRFCMMASWNAMQCERETCKLLAITAAIHLFAYEVRCVDAKLSVLHASWPS